MKKISNGEKREKQLRYRFRQLKRSGIISKDTTMKQFRGSEFNVFTTKNVGIKNKEGKEVTYVIYKMVSLKEILKSGGKYGKVKHNKPTKERIIVPKKIRRTEKRRLRHIKTEWVIERAKKRKERAKAKKLLRLNNTT